MLSSASIKLGVADKLKRRRKYATPKDKDRVYLSQCVGKVMAYMRVNKKEDAKEWARKLRDQLVKMELLP